MNLQRISTRELLETLKRRGQAGMIANEGDAVDYQHLEADAQHLLRCLKQEVLDDPFHFGSSRER